MMETLLAGLNAAQDLQQVSEAMKERVLTLIDAHFAAHPAPVSRLEEDTEDEPQQANLLDYRIDTRKFEGVSMVELHAEGFIYQPDYSDNGWESYSFLSLAELLDVLSVLENERASVAAQV